jgi:starvation-inducible DNA-binding protein
MEQLIEQMKVILATNFALYLKTQNYHWNVEGPLFAQYHDFFGDLYDDYYGAVDPTAENIRKLGAYAPGSLSRFKELSDVQDAITTPDARTMVFTLLEDNERLIVHTRAGIVLADDAGEPAISNFLQDRLDKLQKHSWMLRSFLK